MSDNALATAIYPGGPDNAPAAAPTAAPAPAPAAETPAAETATPAAETETTPTLLTEKEAATAEPEKPAEPPPEPFDAEKITMPEGMKADPEILGKFNEIATKGKVSQETAQELINLYHSVASTQAKQNWDTWQTTQASWVAAVKADGEIGNLEEVKKPRNFLTIQRLPAPKREKALRLLAPGITRKSSVSSIG
jgi:hypothetical protein